MPYSFSNPRTARRQEAVQPTDTFAGAAGLREKPAIELQVRRSLRIHPVLAGVVATVVFSLLVGFALTRKPVYTAESLVYVEPLEQRVLSDGGGGDVYDAGRYDSYLQQQVQTVERDDTLEAALARMPPGEWTGPGQPAVLAVRRLENSLKVERVLNSYQLSIDVTASTAAAAADAANAITQAYLEEGRKDEHTRADQRLQLLHEEQERITSDMAQDKAEQASLGASLGVANPGVDGSNPYDLQTTGLRTQLDAAREAHDAVAAQLASVSGANGTGLDTAANELILNDPGLVSIKQTLGQRRAVLSEAMAGLTSSNPLYKQDLDEIASIDRSLVRANSDARIRAERQLQDKLRLDLRRTADVEGRLNAQLAQQTAKATGAGPKLQRAAELQTDLQRLSARYATVDNAIRGLQLETGGPGQAHLVLAARVPDSPKASRVRLLLLLALPLALLCGMSAAILARKRDQRLYIDCDLEDVLGFPPMCVLPNPVEVSSPVFDDFLLRLAGGLESAYRHGNARSFIWTPVSIRVGADALLPKLCTKLQQIGFDAVCVQAAELLPNSGPMGTAQKAAHTGVGRATTQLDRLRGDHDVVLVQAPPLLGSALAEYAVRCADATVLLVKSGHTTRTDVRRAATLLERLHAQGVGAVLTDTSLRTSDPAFRETVDAIELMSPQYEMKRPATHVAPVPDVAEQSLPVEPSVFTPAPESDEIPLVSEPSSIDASPIDPSPAVTPDSEVAGMATASHANTLPVTELPERGNVSECAVDEPTHDEVWDERTPMDAQPFSPAGEAGALEVSPDPSAASQAAVDTPEWNELPVDSGIEVASTETALHTVLQEGSDPEQTESAGTYESIMNTGSGQGTLPVFAGYSLDREASAASGLASEARPASVVDRLSAWVRHRFGSAAEPTTASQHQQSPRHVAPIEMSASPSSTWHAEPYSTAEGDPSGTAVQAPAYEQWTGSVADPHVDWSSADVPMMHADDEPVATEQPGQKYDERRSTLPYPFPDYSVAPTDATTSSLRTPDLLLPTRETPRWLEIHEVSSLRSRDPWPAARQRAGLAKAAAHAGVQDGPPARASEGLSAMRMAGLRKAMVRQEAVLRGDSGEVRAAEQHSGMSRRWAMLSRFERHEVSPAEVQTPDATLQDSDSQHV